MASDDRKKTLTGIPAPPRPGAPARPTSIIEAEIRAKAPPGALKHFPKGTIIKESGESLDVAYVVVSGNVQIEMDLATVSGKKVYQLGVANTHDLVNEAKLFGFDGSLDVMKRYRARMDVHLMELKPPVQLGQNTSPLLLYNFARSLVRRNADLAHLLTREVTERFRRQAEFETRVEHAARQRTRDIEERLASAAGELAQAQTENERLMGMLAAAEREAETLRVQKAEAARDTRELVEQFERQLAGAAASAIDFFLRTARTLGLDLKPEQIERARDLTRTLAPNYSEDDVERMLDDSMPTIETVEIEGEVDLDPDEDPDAIPSRKTMGYEEEIVFRDGKVVVQPDAGDDDELGRTGRYSVDFFEKGKKKP